MNTSAVVFEAPASVSIREIVVPPPARGEVQVRTALSVISAGTEGHCLQSRFSWQATPFPCVPGYQRVGTVELVGEGVEEWKVGERVMASLANFDAATSGVSAQWGAHAGLANSPVGALYRLPDGIDDVDAACGVVAQVGWNAASRAVLQRGDWVLVVGDGLIGHMAAQAARARGARVVLAGRRAERLALARRFSADLVVNTREENLVEAVRRLIGQPFVTAVFDSIQGEEIQAQYLDLLPNERGQIIYCGNSTENTWANMAHLQQRELSAHFVSGFTPERMNATLQAMARREMSVAPLVTHRVSFRDAPSLYRLILQKNEPFLGLVLDWTV